MGLDRECLCLRFGESLTLRHHFLLGSIREFLLY
jgi:hypothetical protein